jgi:hypothetical protein
MIAAFAFGHDELCAVLEKLGCKKVAGKVFEGKTQQHFLWETPWEHQFLVPHHCTQWELEQIIKRDFDGSRPKYNG